MYYLDFWHFSETGESVTGLDYSAWEFGPVPATLYEELSDNQMKPDLTEAVKIISNNQFQKIVPKTAFDLKYFSKREKRLLNKAVEIFKTAKADDMAVEIFKTAKADDMVESTHIPNNPWHETLTKKGKFQHIDYLLAINGDSRSISRDEALNRTREREEMYRNFGKL